MKTPLQYVASILGRPVEKLHELDRRPLSLAFLDGRYETFVVRDLISGEILEVTVDLESGRRVDPVELRNRDRQRAIVEGRKLTPKLLELLLRHPDIEQMRVRLNFSLESLRLPRAIEADRSDVDLHQEFQSKLDAERRRLGINKPLRVPPDSLVLEDYLSARQVVKLASSKLIKSIDVVSEPEIPNNNIVAAEGGI